jgi:hypothetical protein
MFFDLLWTIMRQTWVVIMVYRKTDLQNKEIFRCFIHEPNS